MTKLLLGLLFSLFVTGKSTISEKTIKHEHVIFKLNIKNKIKRLISVAIVMMPYNRATDVEEDWQTKAWYNLSPGETLSLETWNRIFYYYAESKPDFFGAKLYWKGSKYRTIDGEECGFKEIKINSDFRSTLEYDSESDCYIYNLNLVKY